MPGRTGTPHIGSVTASRGRVMMIHPDIQAMLVRERSATLLAAAAAYRRGRQARAAAAPATAAPATAAPATAAPATAAPRAASATARRAAASKTAARGTAERRQVVLRDGSAVLIRPVRFTDAPLLADGFARLSERSRRLRFLGRKTTLTEADLRYYT